MDAVSLDAVSRLIRLARPEGTVDKRCLLAGRVLLDHPAPVSGEVPFHLLLEGVCTLEVHGAAIELVAGDVVLLPRGPAHVVHSGGGRALPVREERGAAFTTIRTLAGDGAGDGAASRPIDLFCGHYLVTPGAGGIFFGTLPDIVHARLGPDGNERIRLLSALMRAEADLPELGTPAILSALCEVLLAMVLRRAPDRPVTGTPPWTALADPRLRAVTDAVLEAPGHDWTLAELARVAAMSRATFARHFSQQTGMTFGAFLTQVRMMAAAELLGATDLPVSAVASTVGYRSTSAFGRVFRSATSVTPAAFRRHGSSASPM
jgi:AraC family transcriptional regulator, activator of mtrCDE